MCSIRKGVAMDDFGLAQSMAFVMMKRIGNIVVLSPELEQKVFDVIAQYLIECNEEGIIELRE